jgi:hypothetical protein
MFYLHLLTSTPSHDSAVTMTTTASQLARGFGIIIRQIADLLTMLQDYQGWPLLRGILRLYFNISVHIKSELISGMVLGRGGLMCCCCLKICQNQTTLGQMLLGIDWYYLGMLN